MFSSQFCGAEFSAQGLKGGNGSAHQAEFARGGSGETICFNLIQVVVSSL